MANKLFISNFSRSVTQMQLQKYFSLAEKVFSARIIVGEDGFCKGYGFVEIATQEEAKNAKTVLNYIEVDGMEIEIMEEKHQI
jgi:cold-inducible RNA-binding protein